MTQAIAVNRFGTPLPSGFVTFLFTDIEGSTQLFRNLGDDFEGLSLRHDALLRSVWEAHHGVEVRTEGDAFFVAFQSPNDALIAAASVQIAIAGETWPSPEPVRVRVGLHSGLAAPSGSDYVAYAVHQAARVVGAAHGGQSLASEQTVIAAGGPSATTRDLGRFRLRDFEDPVRLYSIDPPGLPPDTRLPRATPATGHNLGVAVTSFVGRAEDLAEVERLVEAGRLVSILGPGGSGKTRLAAEVGRRIAADWPGGVWMVELAPVPAGAPIGGAVTDAMGVSPADRDPLDAIAEDFATSTSVVMLDNCEHVIEAAAEAAARLLRQAPTLGLVATSREPLGIGGERTWRIGPLAPGSAAELFLNRSSMGDVAESDRLAIARIAERLGGNALAIELAAAQVTSVGVDALEAGLDDRFQILRTRRRDLDQRQQSLTALLGWSYDLLSPTERRVLRALAAFRHHFDLDGATIAAGEQSPGEVTDAVWALIDKSLLTIDSGSGETRYAMTETVRAYAGLQLEQADEQAGVFDRLADWYLGRFGPARDLDTGELSALRVELDNVIGVSHGIATTSVERAQSLAVRVAYLRDVSSQFRQGLAEAEAFLRLLPSVTPTRAVLLAAVARLRMRLGDFDFGAVLDEAENVVAEVGEPLWARGVVAVMRALYLNAHGRTAEAIARVGQLVDDDQPLEAHARGFNALGMLASATGNDTAALAAYRNGLAVEQGLGGHLEIAIGHNNVAEHALRLGHVEEAARHQLSALDMAVETGSLILVAFSLVIATRIAVVHGRWEQAARLHGAAQHWLREVEYQLADEDAAATEDAAAATRRELGDRFDVLVAEGEGLSLEEAVAAGRGTLQSR